MPKHMSIIVPTILTNDPIDFETKINKISGLVERVQIDVLDGIFLPEKTVDLEMLGQIESRLRFDIHLMVNKPEEWVNRCKNVLADTVIGQVEMMEDQENFIIKVTEAGMEVGLGVDTKTPIEAISEESLQNLDLVLVLTRKAGFNGGDFQPSMLDKVKKLKDKTPFLKICVDGGLNESNIKKCIDAGADYLAIGKEIWSTQDLRGKLEKLRNLETN